MDLDLSYSDMSEVSMAIVCVALLIHFNSGQFACAYYDPQKCTIYALEDTQGSARHDAMRLREDYDIIASPF